MTSLWVRSIMFSKENYKAIRNLEIMKIIFHEKLCSLDREMYFFTTSASTLPKYLYL